MPSFRERFAVAPLLLLLFTSCRTTQTTSRTKFIHSTQVGIAIEKSGKECLEIHNNAVPVDSKMLLVFPTSPQSAAYAKVIGRVDDGCPTIDAADKDLHTFAISASDGVPISRAPAIAVLGAQIPFTRTGDFVTADLDQVGRPEFFRSCTSTEGIHFTIWPGKPLDNKPVWHQYLYLGYDVTPNCTERDTASNQ